MRLRTEYEKALSGPDAGQSQRVIHDLSAIAEDLCNPPAKRKRQQSPLWERRLRYAVHCNLADVHLQLGEHVKAVGAYVRALDDDRSDFLTWIKTARAASSCGRLHVARRAYEVALTMRPNHWLAKNPYKFVLQAIGDSDDDICPISIQAIEPAVADMVTQRDSFLREEVAEAQEHPKNNAEHIFLQELSWACLVDALRRCLESRMSCRNGVFDYSVGHPVVIEYPKHLAPASRILAPHDCGEEIVDVMVVDDENTRKNSAVIEIDSSPEKSPGVVNIDSDSSPSAKGEATEKDREREDSECDRSEKQKGLNILISEPPSESGDHVQCMEEGLRKQSNLTGDGNENHQEVAATNKALSSELRNGKGSEERAAKRDGDDQGKPELRRSTRAKPQVPDTAQEDDRRWTRTVTGMMDSTHVDAQLVSTLLEICHKSQSIDTSSTASIDKNSLKSSFPSRPVASRVSDARPSSWAAIVDEATEASEVEKCITSFGQENSGPADLMLRVLSAMAQIKVSQYSSTLALLWSTLRQALQLHLPGSPEKSAQIIESLLISGRKAGKAKVHRFEEAARLLSQMKLPEADDDVAKFLKIRLCWCWTILHECREEMQCSFDNAQRTLSLLRHAKKGNDYVLPDVTGPELAGYTIAGFGSMINAKLARLKLAGDLEKAEQELLKVNHGDREAAVRTVSILASSVHGSVESLGLDRWDEDDMKIEFPSQTELEKWERRLDAEAELEPRLIVFGQACAKSSDVVGELACFSIRLRMAVHYYAAKLRSELQKNVAVMKDGDSSEGRLADLLVQIRKYVALVKKVSSPASSSLWNDNPGISGWSLRRVSSIATITLVSLSKLIITKIPVLKFSLGNADLGASQKNRRLGFTRCMLAFVRCLVITEQCKASSAVEADTGSQNDGDFGRTRRMLFAISFCLRALVARGCCREEGTSGALIKLYVQYLSSRLQEIASIRQNTDDERQVGSTLDRISENDESSHSTENKSQASVGASQSLFACDGSEDATLIPEADAQYKWNNVGTIRNELAQCYQCLYQIQDLESAPSIGQSAYGVRWLEEGCRVSKHIGLSFATGDPASLTSSIDTDVSRSIYFFYRKRIFEAINFRRRDGGRGKRLREVLSRLAEALPEDPPNGVKMLSFQALDNIVSDVVDSKADISREAAENVSRLEEEWSRCGNSEEAKEESIDLRSRNVQHSILYFEVFSLHAMSILSAHDADYKKQKSAERRKSPKEVAERLLTASSECLIALRSRPWSVGAWILLGRIFVEIADLALDERELCFSSFGLYRPEDVTSLGERDMVETIFGRAEACFAFADSLLQHSWARKAASEVIEIKAASIFGYAFEDSDTEGWCGFGDDGDLFGAFGLTNFTTSRPRILLEPHPGDANASSDKRRLAAIRFGSSALSILRLRELRYFHVHWTHSTFELKLLTHPRNRFPANMVDLASLALEQLKEGRELYGMPDSFQQPPSASDRRKDTALPSEGSPEHIMRKTAPWRTDSHAIGKLQWYFSMLEAKLLRKVGRPAAEYLRVFQRSVDENKVLREQMRQPRDIEPIYKLHVSRMKILQTIEDNSREAIATLNLLDQYSFKEQQPLPVDGASEKDLEDVVAERKTAIAEDILSAMQFCSNPKSDVPYSEFYFKTTFCRAVLLAEVLKDTKSAMEELAGPFRMDAAIRALDQGPDGVHRGYFYKIWNYRLTDTGIEPALESERKLIRWRSKLLGLYGQHLKNIGEWRLLAAIIYRLKKRNSEDLPVDGALLDDLIEAYAAKNRTSILTSLEKGIVTDASAFEASFRRTWDIYVESLRLAQGVKRVRLSVNRGEKSEVGAGRLLQSGRPLCLVPIHTALRLEHMRWKFAMERGELNLSELKSLPDHGSIRTVSMITRKNFVETMQICVNKWPLDEKMTKLLVRRIGEYTVE